MKADLEILTDLQCVDNYIEKCRDFVNPILLKDIQSRGLYNVINFLPNDINEAKSIARARMAKMGKCFGDDEIDHIANTVNRVEFLRNKLNGMSMTDCDKVLPILNEMRKLSENIKDYYKR